MIEYKSIINATKNCIEINKTKPSAIEFVDRTTLNQIKFKFDKKTKCLLFVEYDEKINSNENKIKPIITGKISQEIKKEFRYFAMVEI